MQYSQPDFLNAEPLITVEEASRQQTMNLAVAVFLGVVLGIAFSLCWARMSGAL